MMFRKSIFLLSLGLLLLLFAKINTGQIHAAVAGFPDFQFDSVVLETQNLNYNPTDEIIFPSVIRAADYFSAPLGTYYMYYSPHNAPGGISLAYANSLDGPWIEYANNPVISNNWQPHYSVNHVASSWAFWMQEENKLFMYFHGNNDVTRLATSTDGITFTYEQVVINAANLYASSGEASYAKVFRYTIPSKGNKFIMVFMGRDGSLDSCCNRNIYLAWSDDGRNWTLQTTPLITPQGNEGDNLSGPYYYPLNGNHYIVYHGSSDNIHVTEVGANFDQENHLGVLYDDVAKAASPTFITEGNTTYMFYTYGPRLNQDIALAKSVTPSSFETVIVDNLQATTTGAWVASTGASPFYGSNYYHDDNADKGQKTITYQPTLAGGMYEVFGYWTAHPNRATNAPFTIQSENGTSVVLANQQANGGSWNSLGVYTFAPGTSGAVTIGNSGTNGYVAADAVQFTQLSAYVPPPTATSVVIPTPQPTATPIVIPPPPETILDNTDATGVTVVGAWVPSTGTSDPFYGSNYFHDGNANKGQLSVTYSPSLANGTYTVYIRYTSNPNRATNVSITVNYAGGQDALTVNQRNNGGVWVPLGNYVLNGQSSVVISNTNTNGYTVADAVKFVFVSN